MDYITIIGFTASALTTVSFIPQVIKIWKTKSTEDISLYMYLIFCIGIVLWILYGIFLNSSPIIVTNIIAFGLSLVILISKIKYG